MVFSRITTNHYRKNPFAINYTIRLFMRSDYNVHALFNQGGAIENLVKQQIIRSTIIQVQSIINKSTHKRTIISSHLLYTPKTTETQV